MNTNKQSYITTVYIMYRIRNHIAGGFVSSFRSAVHSHYYTNDGPNSGENHYARHALYSANTYYSHLEEKTINTHKQQTDIRNLFCQLPGTIEP